MCLQPSAGTDARLQEPADRVSNRFVLCLTLNCCRAITRYQQIRLTSVCFILEQQNRAHIDTPTAQDHQGCSD